MKTLKVEVAENGFIVSESAGVGMCGKLWAFESADSLAEFMKGWGHDNTKTSLNGVTARVDDTSLASYDVTEDGS